MTFKRHTPSSNPLQTYHLVIYTPWPDLYRLFLENGLNRLLKSFSLTESYKMAFRCVSVFLFHKFLHLINTCFVVSYFAFIVICLSRSFDDFWFGIGYEAFVAKFFTNHVEFFCHLLILFQDEPISSFDIEKVSKWQVDFVPVMMLDITKSGYFTSANFQVFWICEAFDVVNVVIEEGIELLSLVLIKIVIGLLGAPCSFLHAGVGQSHLKSFNAWLPLLRFQTLDEPSYSGSHDRSFRDLAINFFKHK